MNSWYQLLLLTMDRGEYLRKRPVTQYDWLSLWALVQDVEKERVDDGMPSVS